MASIISPSPSRDKTTSSRGEEQQQYKSKKMHSQYSGPSAFERLPDEIVQQILQLTDPNSFASLILSNSKWRRVSQQAHLYAHQLAQCPSYSASHKRGVPEAWINDDGLPKLRRLFAREVKRNLFDAYLRPRTTTIKLVSNSISSSSAPGGEGMQFSPSPRGHHLLAYNSSRIYVIDTRSPQLDVKRELKILRRPVSTCIVDDGSLLAVLSSDMQVDLYDLRQHPPKRTQSLILDHTPRTIALSPCGSVLAAAYEGGIEVSSLRPGALPTERRAVKCDGVDSLAFSFDGTQLLGTTTYAQPSNTVILTAPYYDPGSHMGDDSMSALWTTSILFPNTSRDCSNAVLIQESSCEEAAWAFTYDRSYETFRAVRIDDLRNGTSYFTGPIPNTTSQPTLLPCTLPAASYYGELVAAGFEGKDVWLYGIPEDLEAVPDASSTASESAAQGLNRRNSAQSRSSSRVQENNGGRPPQWQVLCDKLRNTFVSGRKITQLGGVSTVKWVAGYGKWSLQERLIVAARGVQPHKLITEEDGIDFVDGGRITILDFDYGVDGGEPTDITIDVGTKEPEVLEEEHRDMATEVAIVRRRTVAQRRGSRPGVIRSTTSAETRAETLLRNPVPTVPALDDADDPLIPRRMRGPREARLPTEEIDDDPEGATYEEAQEALDAPYAHASPRSGTTLRRAATAAAVNRRLHPSAATNGHIVYRRADGRAEHPHESDADNWVPPPPPYTKDDPGDMPAFLRHASIPGVGLGQSVSSSVPSVPPVPPLPAPSTPPSTAQRPREQPSSHPASSRPELPRIHTSPLREPIREGRPRTSYQQHDSHQRNVSNTSRNSLSRAEDSSRPMSSPSIRYSRQSVVGNEFGNYEVSPIESPRSGRFSRQVQAQAQDTIQGRLGLTSPQVPSSGSASSGTEFTPASSNSHVTAESSRGAPNQFALSLSLPSPSLNLRLWSEDTAGSEPAVGRLPNAQTWPRALSLSQEADLLSSTALTSYPQSAPAMANEDSPPSLPPLPRPRPEQLASLNNRQDQTAPRRASGSFQIPRVPIGRNAGRNSQEGPDQPLIISTPQGVSGAFDPPGRQTSQRAHTEPILHAPVARHPHSSPASASSRPTVERLETIYSVTSAGSRNLGADADVTLAPPAPPSSQLTSSSPRHHTSVARRQSRARRSAAKNLKDAKGRGWTGRRRNKKKQREMDAASSAAWTDVTWASHAPRDAQVKDKKCCVM